MISESPSEVGFFRGEYSNSESHTLADDDFASMLVMGNRSEANFVDPALPLSVADDVAQDDLSESSRKVMSVQECSIAKGGIKCKEELAMSAQSEHTAALPSERSVSANVSSEPDCAPMENAPHSSLSSTSSWRPSENSGGIRSSNLQWRTEEKNNRYPLPNAVSRNARQLDLNTQNLKNFKETVERGNALPLRTDFVDTRDYPTLPKHSGKGREKNVAFDKQIGESDCNGSFSVRSQGELTGPNSHFAEISCDENIAIADRRHHPSSHEIEATKKENFSKTEKSVSQTSSPPSSSPTSGASGDPLNMDNLKRHVEILSSGLPAILRSENMGLSLEGAGKKLIKKTISFPHPIAMDGSPHSDPPEYSASLRVEKHASEFSLNPEDFRSPLTELSPKLSDGDMWSLQSVGDRGFSDFIAGSNLRALSIENLLQLKRELRSNSMPLRPELLAGLELAVKAISGSCGGTGSEEGRSLFVASSDNATRELMTIDAERSQIEPGVDSKYMGALRELSSELDGQLDLDRGQGRLSFHSMLVEAAPTEIQEAKDEDDGSNSEYVPTLNALEHHSNEAIPDESDHDDAEDRSKSYSDEDDFRDPHNCTVFSPGKVVEKESSSIGFSRGDRHNVALCSSLEVNDCTSSRRDEGEPSFPSWHPPYITRVLRLITRQLELLEDKLERLSSSQNGVVEIMRSQSALHSSLHLLSQQLSDRQIIAKYEEEKRPIVLTVRLCHFPLLKKVESASKDVKSEEEEEEKGQQKAVISDTDEACTTFSHRKSPNRNVAGEVGRLSTDPMSKGDGLAELNATPVRAMEFLFPFSPHTTVESCKRTVLERLHRVHVIDAAALSLSRVQLFCNKKLLFDEDTLYALGVTSGDTLDIDISS